MPAPLGRRLLRGIALGAGAFAVGALLDVIFAHDAVEGFRDVGLLAAAVLGLMALIGALAGAIGALVWPLATTKWGPALLAASGGAALGFKLCSGAWISQVVPPLAGAAISGVLAAPAGLAAAALIRRLGVGLKTAPLWAAAGLALYLCDALVYRPLYPAAHLALFAAYTMAFSLALAAVRPPRPKAIALLVSLAVLAGAGAGAWALARMPAVRFAALERTNAARKVLAVFPSAPAARERPLFLRRPRPAAAPSVAPVVAAREPASDDVMPAGLGDAHVVLVTIDALRADRLGLVRDGVSLTPHLDDLARGAVRFERAYVQAPHSSFSLASLHTSEYVHSTVELREDLPPFLAAALAARGYRTLAFYTSGVFFTGREKVRRFAESRFGFAKVVASHLEAPELTDAVIDEISKLRSEGEPPMFLWAHYFDVHEPYIRRTDFDHGTRSIDRYDSEVAYTDHAVGRLIAALAQLERPTVLCVTSDHGEEFREHGGVYHGSTLYEEQVRVPLLIAAPGLRPRVLAEPVELIDVAPTLLRLVGIEPPASMRGKDLLDVLSGKVAAGPVFSEVDTKKMVVSGSYKLIHDFRLSTWELYDLAADPGERVNLYDRAPAAAEELRAELGLWFDRIEQSVAARDGPRPPGIDLGRLGDRRAVPLLVKLLQDDDAAKADRSEAAGLLGRLQDRSALPGLRRALAATPPGVREEVAIAIGELFDERGREALRETIEHPDLHIRARAGIALAKLGDRRAAPALLDGLAHPDFEVRRRIVHYLGMVAGAEAIEPLLELSSDPRLRYLVTLSLGRIGGRTEDPRVLPFLRDRLEGDSFADVRGYAAVAMGFLGDPGAIPELTRMLYEQPEIKWTAETLVRLGAVGREVPGVDFDARRRARGIGDCHKVKSTSVDRYLGATWCELGRPGARVFIPLEEPDDYVAILRARALIPDLVDAPLTLIVNGEPLSPVPLPTGWQEFRIQTRADQWKRGRNEVVFHFPGTVGVGRDEGRVGLDHLVLASERAPAPREP